MGILIDMEDFSQNQDIILSTEIANALGYKPWELSVDMEKTAKFKEVVDYLKPYEDRTYIMQKLSRGKTKEHALEHAWRYVGLRKEYEQTKSKYEEITKELSQYD